MSEAGAEGEGPAQIAWVAEPIYLTAIQSARLFKLTRFFQRDLSYEQRKALDDFSDKVEDAIKAGEFVGVKEGDFGVDIGAVEAASDTEPPEELELWGFPLLPSKDACETQVILLKFLRARDFKLDEAFVMLRNCIMWRKRYGVEKILDEDLGSAFDTFAFNHGVGKQKHLVQYNVFGEFQDEAFYHSVFADESTTRKALRWRVQLLEKRIRSLMLLDGCPHSILQVVDLKNAPLLNKQVRSFISQAVKLFTDYYPELVFKIIFLNTPLFIQGIFAFLNPFLTQRTKDKYTFASSLFTFMAPDNIPFQYGGLNKANDPRFKDPARPMVAELVLKAGEKKTVEFDVAGVGYTAVWEFTWGVLYRVEFEPSEGYALIVEEPEVNSSQLPSCGSFDTPGPGRLVFLVENSMSRKEKIGGYRFILKATPAVKACEIKGEVACSHPEHADWPFPEGRIQPLFGDEGGGFYYPVDSELEQAFRRCRATKQEEEAYWSVTAREGFRVGYVAKEAGRCVKNITFHVQEGEDWWLQIHPQGNSSGEGVRDQGESTSMLKGLFPRAESSPFLGAEVVATTIPWTLSSSRHFASAVQPRRRRRLTGGSDAFQKMVKLNGLRVQRSLSNCCFIELWAMDLMHS